MKKFFALSQYESKKRVPAEEAMKHVYFRSLGPRIHALPESKKCSSLFPLISICLGLSIGMFGGLIWGWLLASKPKILVLVCNQIMIFSKQGIMSCFSYLCLITLSTLSLLTKKSVIFGCESLILNYADDIILILNLVQFIC